MINFCCNGEQLIPIYVLTDGLSMTEVPSWQGGSGQMGGSSWIEGLSWTGGLIMWECKTDVGHSAADVRPEKGESFEYVISVLGNLPQKKADMGAELSRGEGLQDAGAGKTAEDIGRKSKKVGNPEYKRLSLGVQTSCRSHKRARTGRQWPTPSES